MKHYLAVFVLNLTILVQGILSSRIAGGSFAYKDQFPYQAQVIFGSDLICGGSIIDERWILTAAQCIINFAPEDIEIIIGTTDRAWGNGMIYQAERLIVHEDFKIKLGPTKIYDNDIALIRVNRDIDFSKYVKLIRVLEYEWNMIENATAILTGWGSNRIDNEYSRYLMYNAELKIFDNPTCNEIWKRISGQGILDSNICTMARVGHGACEGDLGGPLVAFGVQIGIASYVWPCATGIPDVFTRISSYSDWIRSIVLA